MHGKDDAAGIERSEDLDQLVTREAGAIRVVGADVSVGVEERSALQFPEQWLEPRLQ
jgi:hypothetical protein